MAGSGVPAFRRRVPALRPTLTPIRLLSMPAVEAGCTKQGPECVYLVKGNGAGFPMRHADKLFGVFQRLHRAEGYEGTGVGLAIVQRTVHRPGGRIWAEAEVRKAPRFFSTIPRVGPAG